MTAWVFATALVFVLAGAVGWLLSKVITLTEERDRAREHFQWALDCNKRRVPIQIDVADKGLDFEPVSYREAIPKYPLPRNVHVEMIPKRVHRIRAEEIPTSSRDDVARPWDESATDAAYQAHRTARR